LPFKFFAVDRRYRSKHAKSKIPVFSRVYAIRTIVRLHAKAVDFKPAPQAISVDLKKNGYLRGACASAKDLRFT
jgi:hypothetical protein